MPDRPLSTTKDAARQRARYRRLVQDPAWRERRRRYERDYAAEKRRQVAGLRRPEAERLLAAFDERKAARLAPRAPVPPARTCRFITGDDYLDRIRAGASVDSVVCGRPVQPGSSYCPEHHQRCWVKPERPGPHL